MYTLLLTLTILFSYIENPAKTRVFIFASTMKNHPTEDGIVGHYSYKLQFDE
jgi:hypothetical protein